MPSQILAGSGAVRDDLNTLWAEFLSFPGMCLSVEQVARLLDLRLDEATQALSALEDEGLLFRSTSGGYRRASPLLHDVTASPFDLLRATLSSVEGSGSTNSCSGCLTVSTGQGAVRTTRSATLPITRCATAPRPCVPITSRSVPASRP